NGGWTILFGKPLLAAVGAVHDVRADVVTVNGKGRTTVLENRNPTVWKNEINAAAMAAGHEASMGVKSSAIPPARRVQSVSVTRAAHPHITRGPGSKASTSAALVTTETDKRCEASPGASSCETPPARRVDSAFAVEDTDADVDVGAFIEEVVEDVYDEFDEVEGEGTELETERDAGEEETRQEAETELDVGVEELDNEMGVEMDGLGLEMDEEDEMGRGVGGEGGRVGVWCEAGESGECVGDDRTRSDGEERDAGDADTRVASTGVKSSAIPPARRSIQLIYRTC
ncbi:hypothetical protein B0H13DRAFT_737777, partial [Mycena leptocephala]